MRIGIAGDLHFGHKRGSEQANDCWEAAEQIFKKASRLDLLLLAGDLFNSRIPYPGTWAKALKLFTKFPTRRIKIRKTGKNFEPQFPIVATHGTHERRGGINPVQGLEAAGFLIWIDRSYATLQINDKKVAVHALGGVPEQEAAQAFKEWEPKPLRNCFNILMFHQNLKSQVPQAPGLEEEQIPKGFDLYCCGHLHWPLHDELHQKPLLVPGSPIVTQLNERVASSPRGFWIYNDGKFRFEQIRGRRCFLDSIEARSTTQAKEELTARLMQIASKNYEKKPLVRINLEGKLPASSSCADLDLQRFNEKFDKLLLSIGNKLEEEGLEQKAQLIWDARQKKLSTEERGLSILHQLAQELNISFDAMQAFWLLEQEEIDKTLNMLLKGELDRKIKLEKKEEKIDWSRWLK